MVGIKNVAPWSEGEGQLKKKDEARKNSKNYISKKKMKERKSDRKKE